MATPSTAQPARPIKLYRYDLSGHSHRAELFLNLLRLPYESIDIDLRAKAQKRPEFLALNVFGQVPVIDDAGTVVPDSNAILTYLALKYGAPHWLPREPLGAAQVQRWLSVAAGQLASTAARARVLRVFELPGDGSVEIAGAKALFAVVEETFGDRRPFLIGSDPTIADVALYSYTAHAPEGNVPLEPYPALCAWLGRIEALPGFVPMRASAVGLRAVA
ncbi:glutathione S-transferase [Ramlibacter solisilvae]|uniref:Glutathione S-transferase n=1 Tax=Ramlibacter tataouinensis TaxID=94132 RepID=A0A140HLA1_9BURK|nr:glutathione S-transferase [Ramlibacter tataouinensis]AMO25634.1 glutathione S-transferase [Ramlibacter tataouinensis]